MDADGDNIGNHRFLGDVDNSGMKTVEPENMGNNINVNNAGICDAIDTVSVSTDMDIPMSETHTFADKSNNHPVAQISKPTTSGIFSNGFTSQQVRHFDDDTSFSNFNAAHDAQQLNQTIDSNNAGQDSSFYFDDDVQDFSKVK